MHVHVGRKKRHAVQPSVRCCLPANGTSPKYSSTLSVDMLLSDRETLESEPLDAFSDPAVGNCNRSSSVSVSMSRDLRLYTYRQISDMWNKTANPPPPPPPPRPSFSSFEVLHYAILRDKYYENERFNFWVRQYLPVKKTRADIPALFDLWQRAFYNLLATTITLRRASPLSRNCQHSYFIHGYLQSTQKKFPRRAASRRTRAANHTRWKNEANPITIKIYWNETSARAGAGTREICHVNRRENKYAWST